MSTIKNSGVSSNESNSSREYERRLFLKIVFETLKSLLMDDFGMLNFKPPSLSETL